MKQSTMIAVIFALLAACGGDAESGRDGTATTAPLTTATAEDVVSTMPGALPTVMTEDLRYHPADEPFTLKSGAVDVIAPTDGGPWPTVVVFHGDPRSAGKGWHRPDARLIAEQGRVVFLPAWGHVDSTAVKDMGAEASWDLLVRELKCAVAFAHSRTAEFGGDPGHVTLYGLSAGGNAVLMAGLTDVEPLDTCSAPGPAIAVQALVPIDADWVLGGDWDSELSANPEAFYSFTPWRFLDASQDIPIHVMVTEITGPYTRSVEPDPATSWLSYRHSDIDLVADLEGRDFLADGDFSLKESGEYASVILTEEGYEATLVVMPGAQHASWGSEGTAVVVDTVLNAEGDAATGIISLSVQDWAGVEGYRLLANAWSEDDDVMAGLSGAAFWIHADMDPFSTQDVIHPPAIPPGNDQPWALGDYLWNETARLGPGTYRIEFYANPGELAPYGNYIPSGAERSCWVEAEVSAGEVSVVEISGIPIGHGPCPVVGS